MKTKLCAYNKVKYLDNPTRGAVGDEVDLGFSPVKVDDEYCISSEDTIDSSQRNSTVLSTGGLINDNTSDNTEMDSPKSSKSCISNISPSGVNENINNNNVLDNLQVSEPVTILLKRSTGLLNEMPNSSQRGSEHCLDENVIINSNDYQAQCDQIDQRTDTVSSNNLTTNTENNVCRVTKNSTLKERKEKKRVPQRQKSLNSHSKYGNSVQDIVRKIEQTLRDWFSVDSFSLIFGEEKLKEILAEKKINGAGTNNLGGKVMDALVYEKYLAICKKLNMLEMEDMKMDTTFKEEFKKPLPVYDALKKEAKEMELKVKMFYKGDKQVQFDETQKDAAHAEYDNSEPESNLPLIDLHAQKALRRRIVTDKIKRVLQDLQKSLCLRDFNLFEEVQRLVSTFELSPHNIMMKPLEWNLITIFIIKLLSVKDKTLELAMNTNTTSKNLTLLLMSYSLDNGYLDRLIVWLSDIEYILQKKS